MTSKANNAFLWTRHHAVRLTNLLWRKYKSLPIFGKLFVWFFILFNVAVLSFIIAIGPDRIAQTLYDLAKGLTKIRVGWMMLGTVMIVTSFPPLIGFSTTSTLCGFAYGLNGFYLAGGAALLGSAAAFVVLRYAFKKRIRDWTRKNDNWKALETVVDAKGLPLIILIRLSPFPPWVYANAMFASIEAVALWQFVVATIVMLPKIFLMVFVGSRIALFSDHEERGKMDPTTKIMNVVSIVISVLIAVIAALVVYRLMQKQIRKLKESPDLTDELAAEALEEAEEGAPLLQNLSSESVLLGSDDELEPRR